MAGVVVPAAAAQQEKFDREKYFPSGWQIGTDEFLALIHRYGYIFKPLGGGPWSSANEMWKLSDTEILKAIACAHPRFYLGARCGKASRFAVLDIDAGSKYHNVPSLQKITATLSDAGLSKSVLFRSSHSGGWHLYVFFDEPISCRDLKKQLTSLLSLRGFRVLKGSLEIFPNPGETGSLGYGLRLPMQPGFAWLDRATAEVLYERDGMHAIEALGMFVADLQEQSHSYHDFHRFKRYVEDLEASHARLTASSGAPATRTPGKILVFAPPANKALSNTEAKEALSKIFFRVPPGIDAATWLRGRQYYAGGLTAPGQRADAIFCLSHYLFYGDPKIGLSPLGYGYEDERQWVIEKILADKHNHQSADINAGHADAITQAERATHWLPAARRDTDQVKFKPEVPLVWVKANEKRKQAARKNICDALERLKPKGRFTKADLQREANCSWRTLYKHRDIWDAEYNDLSNGFFANSTGEFNAVEGAAPSVSLPPSASLSKNVPPPPPPVPPGLLAARRIAYELAMRNAREKRRTSRKTVAERHAQENEWRALVLSAIGDSLDPDQTLAQLKAVLALLIYYLMTASTEEDAIDLQAAISSLKSRLLHLAAACPVRRAKPPPAD